MQLANSTLLQVLLGTSNVMALWQVLDNLFSGPTSGEQSCLGLGETPLHIGHESIIGARGAELVGVLDIENFVGTT